MLNIYTLNNRRDQKEIVKFKIYKKILKRCHHRIRTVSSKGESFTFYIVPEYMFGMPKFDSLNCAQYIVKKLRQNGLHVIYTFPNLLFISWAHVPSEYKHSSIIEESKKQVQQQNNKPHNDNFRMIGDYNVSKNFLHRINNSNVKRIQY